MDFLVRRTGCRLSWGSTEAVRHNGSTRIDAKEVRDMAGRRVPLRQQLTEAESGAACLAMVLGHHGRQLTVPAVRALLGPDPLAVAGLTAAAEAQGLDVRVDRSTDPLDGELTGPGIAYLSRGHFTVVERADRRRVWVSDPALGRQRLSRAQFMEDYGGVLLVLTPSTSFTKHRIPLRDTTMVRYLREFVAAPGGRGMLAATIGLAAVLQLFGLAAPLLTKLIVDTVLPAERGDLLAVCGVGVVAVGVFYGVLTLLRSLTMLAVRIRGDWRLTRGFVAHLMRLPMGFFAERGRGDLLLRLSSVSSSRELLTQQLLTVVMDGCLLLGYLVGLVLLSPLYSLVLAPLLLMHALVVTSSYRSLRTLSQRELSAKSAEQSFLVEALEAITALKAGGAEDQAVRRWETLFERYQQAVTKRGKATARLAGGQRGVGAFGRLLLLWAGAWLVMNGAMSLGDMLAASSVALAVLAPMESFAGSGQLYHAVRAQVERLFDVLDTKQERSGTVRLPAGRPNRITLRAVTFRYGSRQAPALSEVSLDLPAGQKLGVVGRTGSGKSTLGLILLGLLRPEHGEVRHDGVTLADLDLADLRAHSGAVLQELSLFQGTIRENLTLARPDASATEVIEAATLAGLHDDVLALPLGYETPVGQGGTALSSGQRQRVALARALVHRPRLLVLDEATSHLDPETERRVDDALATLDVTRVVISHRLNAVRNADLIVSMDGGRVAQRGTHHDLLTVPGVYRDLFGEALPSTDPVLSH